MSSPSKRRESDVIKLIYLRRLTSFNFLELPIDLRVSLLNVLFGMMNDYKVGMIGDELNELHVEFHGPKETLYEGGVWKIHVLFPESYPYDPRHITFTNKIYHLKVCEGFGFVCLNVLANDWNSTLASLMMTDKQQYGLKLKEYCERYAKGQAANQAEEGRDDGDTSSGGSEPSIDETLGHLDP